MSGKLCEECVECGLYSTWRTSRSCVREARSLIHSPIVAPCSDSSFVQAPISVWREETGSDCMKQWTVKNGKSRSHAAIGLANIGGQLQTSESPSHIWTANAFRRLTCWEMALPGTISVSYCQHKVCMYVNTSRSEFPEGSRTKVKVMPRRRRADKGQPSSAALRSYEKSHSQVRQSLETFCGSKGHID